MRATRQGCENTLETLERAKVTFGRGGLFDCEHPGRLGGGQFLEVAQREDFAVHRVQRVEGLLDAEDALGANHGLGRGGVSAEKLSRQRGRAGCRQGAGVERYLAAGVAHLGAQVVPVQAHQPLAHDQAEPEEERQFGLIDVIREALGDFDECLLDHVGGVEAALEARVEADLHQPAQPLAMQAQQRVEGLSVRRAGPLEQIRGIGRVVLHQGYHTLIPAPVDTRWTAGQKIFSPATNGELTAILGVMRAEGVPELMRASPLWSGRKGSGRRSRRGGRSSGARFG
jgi:hypothetical protein